MASFVRHEKKNGGLSYQLRVYMGRTGSGRTIIKTSSWGAPEGISHHEADAQARIQAEQFERYLKGRDSHMDYNITLGELCQLYISRSNISLKTVDLYLFLMERIQPELGHIPVRKLRGFHLDKFYDYLGKTKKNTGGLCKGKHFKKCFEMSGNTIIGLARKSDVSRWTIKRGVDVDGDYITRACAEQIAIGIDIPFRHLFTEATDACLSEGTIIKYHRLLCAVLNRAVRYGLIDRNVAITEATSPKTPYKKTKEFDLFQAKAFRIAALDDPDIRVKTMVILLLYTGIRRGELCGLSWCDIHTQANQIDICRASQYFSNRGIIETAPKTDSSIRTITVGQECMDVIKQYAHWWRKEKYKQGIHWFGESERLFVQRNGSPISPGTIGRST